MLKTLNDDNLTAKMLTKLLIFNIIKVLECQNKGRGQARSL